MTSASGRENLVKQDFGAFLVDLLGQREFGHQVLAGLGEHALLACGQAAVTFAAPQVADDLCHLHDAAGMELLEVGLVTTRPVGRLFGVRRAQHVEHLLESVRVDDVANPDEIEVARRNPDDQVVLADDPEHEVECLLALDRSGFDVFDDSGAMVRVSASGEAMTSWSQLAPGTRVRATVRLAEAESGEAVSVLVRAREPPVTVSPPATLDAAVERVRAGLRASAAHLEPEPRALVPALVVGDTSAMPGSLVDRFKVTGLTHLTAVSGANLTLLLVFLRVVAVGVGVRGRGLTAVLIAGVAAFVALYLGEPSVVRAAAMAPRSAAFVDSVAPEVNTISVGRAPRSAANGTPIALSKMNVRTALQNARMAMPDT